MEWKRIQLVVSLAVVALGAGATDARAESPVAIAVIASDGVDQATADAVSEVMASAWASAKGVVRPTDTLVVGPAVRAQLAKQGQDAFACLSTPTCRDGVRRDLFSGLWVGELRGDEGGSIELRLVSVDAASGANYVRTLRSTQGWWQLVAEVREMAVEASGPLSVLRVDVGEQGGAFTIDSEPHPLTSGVASFAVPAGEHAVRWIHPDGRELVASVLCEAGAECRVGLTSPVAEPEPQNELIVGFAWGTLALSVAAASTGVGLAVYGNDRSDEANRLCPGSVCTASQSRVAGIVDEGRAATDAANALFVIAGASAATSLGLFIADWVDADDSEHDSNSGVILGMGTVGFRF